MDLFKEFIVKKELTSGEKASRTFIIIACVALAASFLIFTLGTILQIFGFVFAALSVYIGWQLISRFFIEYEYIVTNTEMDIDKITNQASRKRLITVDLHKDSEYGKVDDSFSAGDDDTVIQAYACNPDLDDYYLKFTHKQYGSCVLVFTPSMEIIDIIKPSLPRNVVAKL